jgi:glycosyltransferase involved in cell wall biosynthesis
MKYPNIIFFRHESYKEIDTFLNDNKDKLDCTLNITSERNDLRKLFDSNYHILITYGKDQKEYFDDVSIINIARFRMRWIHQDKIDLESFNRGVNYCFVHNAQLPREITRAAFSIFTSCYNSYDKIFRPYNSLKAQTFLDWEWVVVDDSPDDKHFNFLRTVIGDDPRVRLYRRSKNSGNIGAVKNETIGLCRGSYLLELDHDDEILKDCLADAVRTFQEDSKIGFVYMDCVMIHEDGSPHSYGDHFGLGYAGYYCQKFKEYKGTWLNVIAHPNINNVTCTHIVAVPNHPRIWRRETLMNLGSYSEFLPIVDDLEILLRTAVGTTMARVHKPAYVQYMNTGGNNFQFIRNSEINRLGTRNIVPQAYHNFKIDDHMRSVGAHEEQKTEWWNAPMWKRPGFEYKYCNKVFNYDITKQYCYLGFDVFIKHKEEIRVLLADPKKDVFVLANDCTREELCKVMDDLGFDNIKCYAIKGITLDELRRYFLLVCKRCDTYEIIESGDKTPHTTSSELWVQKASVPLLQG